MKPVRFVGNAPQAEASISGVGSTWWPGEVRRLPDARAALLLAAGRGWNLARDDEAPLNVVHSGLWAARPTPADAGVGAEMICTDFGVGGSSRWWSDGTYWRPLNGSVTAAVLSNGTIGGASSGDGGGIASLTGNGAAQAFALPTPIIFPAGMLFPGMGIVGSCIARKYGTHTGSIAVGMNTSEAYDANTNITIRASNAADDSTVAIAFETTIGVNTYLGAVGNMMAAFLHGNSTSLPAGRTALTVGPNTVPIYLWFGINTSWANSEARLLQVFAQLRG